MENKNWAVLSTVLLVFVLILGACVVIQENQKAASQNSCTVQANQSAASQKNQNDIKEAISTTQPAWDKLWSVYTSEQGISFKYPKQTSALDRCDGEKHDPYVATKILEDKEKGIIYVAPEYYYDYPATKDGSQDTSKPCQKITYSLDQINGKGEEQTAYYPSGSILGGLNINVRSVANQDELKKFVKDVFGSACEVETPQEGTGGVEVNVQATSMEGDCPMNFGYKIIYNKEKSKAFAINLGQDCGIDNGNINADKTASYECYTPEIADSIKFD